MNVVICPRCNLEMIAEEYRNHNCIAEFKGTKTIPLSHYYDAGLDENGDKILMMISDDGHIYRGIYCNHSIPHNLPHQPEGNTDKTTDNETAPKTDIFN